MAVKATHTPQLQEDALYELKKEAFFRISEQVGSLQSDSQIPVSLRNISLYLGDNSRIVYKPSQIKGLYSSRSSNVFVKEYIKLDNSNWMMFVHIGQENSVGQVDKIAIGSVDGAIKIAPKGTERVISLTTTFANENIQIIPSELREHFEAEANRTGYPLGDYEEGVYLLDSPAPLFANDTAMTRDSDFVGLWISFGTMLKYDLSNLSNFNIDGVKVGAIDINNDINSIQILKMLSNCAFGYATILLDKELLLADLMKYSKKFVYETNMQDTTRICVDNVLETLQEKGLFGMLYEEMEAIKEYPIMAFDEHTGKIHRDLQTVLKFKYKKEYIYMLLDSKSEKMYFLSYAGDISTYENSKYNYSVKVSSSLWLSKSNRINLDGFVLFTGFPNLQHNKVLDIYFDNTSESFSSLDKNFSIDVSEFDKFFDEESAGAKQNSYEHNTDLIHSFGNNSFPLVSGLVGYRFKEVRNKIPYFSLQTSAEPTFSTMIDVVAKKAFLFTPALKMNCDYSKSYPTLEIMSFLKNYVSMQLGIKDAKEFVGELEGGSYVYAVQFGYYADGWTLFKTDDNTFECKKTDPIRLSYAFNGAVEQVAMDEAKSILEIVQKLQEQNVSPSDIEERISDSLNSATNRVHSKINVAIKGMALAFDQEIIRKTAQIPKIIDSQTPSYVFDRFLDSDTIYVNNAPTGPALNHALLFEDTFNNIYLQHRSHYLSLIDMNPDKNKVHCPYLIDFTMSMLENKIHLIVDTDVSNSISVSTNDVLGLSALGEMLSANGEIEIEGELFPYSEAYSKEMTIQYFGIRNIDGKDFNIFKLTDFTTMSDEVAKAYNKRFLSEASDQFSAIGIDFEEAKKEMFSFGKGDYQELSVPRVPGGQPLYVAMLENKLMVSLDGEEYSQVNPGFSFDLSARLKINSRLAFISSLQNLVNMRITETTFSLFPEEVHDKEDIYNVSIKEVILNAEEIHLNKIHITTVCQVDNGSIVLYDNKNIVYQEGESFAFEQSVSIDGFVRKSAEEISYLAVAKLKYYSKIVKDNHVVDTADELLGEEDTYLIELNLPFTVVMEASSYIFADINEARHLGLDDQFVIMEEKDD